MINVKELTLGCRVKSKSTGKLIVVRKISPCKINNGISTSDVEGIKITEDVLLEDGYEKCKDPILGRIEYKKEINGFYVTVNDLSNYPGDRDYSVHIDSPNFSTVGGNGDIGFLHQLDTILNLIVWKE